jgi:hypothetical protein
MTQGCGWWLAMLAGWSLLCLVHCSDSGLDDHAPAVQTVTELTLVELGLRLVPEGFTVTDLPPKETEAEGSSRAWRAAFKPTPREAPWRLAGQRCQSPR